MKTMSMMIPYAGSIARLRKDGVVEVRIADEHVCTVEQAKEAARIFATLGEGQPVPVLRIFGRHTSMEEGVREFMASEAFQKYILADAIVIHSLAQRILINFYLKTNRPRKPTRVFTNQAEAEDWLRTFIPCLN